MDDNLERPLGPSAGYEALQDEGSSSNGGFLQNVFKRFSDSSRKGLRSYNPFRRQDRNESTSSDSDSEPSANGAPRYLSLPHEDDETGTAGLRDVAVVGEPTTSSSNVHEENDKSDSDKSTDSIKRKKSHSLGRISSLDNINSPVCLICLDPLTAEDFESGEAIQLECQCRGDLAMRHKTCAAKWAGVKGDNVCDICKAPIANLPPPIMPDPPLSVDGDLDAAEGQDMLHMGPHPLEPPSSVDMVFDCIRVMWVAMIVCILFFEMNLSNALWTGVIVGLTYTVFMRFMYRSHMVFSQHYQQHPGVEPRPSTMPSTDGRMPVAQSILPV